MAGHFSNEQVQSYNVYWRQLFKNSSKRFCWVHTVLTRLFGSCYTKCIKVCRFFWIAARYTSKKNLIIRFFFQTRFFKYEPARILELRGTVRFFKLSNSWINDGFAGFCYFAFFSSTIAALVQAKLWTLICYIAVSTFPSRKGDFLIMAVAATF